MSMKPPSVIEHDVYKPSNKYDDGNGVGDDQTTELFINISSKISV